MAFSTYLASRSSQLVALNAAALTTSTITAGSTINTTTLFYSTMLGSTITVSTLFGSTLATTGLVLSTLTGSTITVSTLFGSTLTGSTITASSIIARGLVLSTLTGSTITVSTLVGSTLSASTLTASSIVASGLVLSTITVSSINNAVPGTGTGVSAFSTLTVSSIVSVSSITTASTMYTSSMITTGRVGIGSAAPSAALDITGTTKLGLTKQGGIIFGDLNRGVTYSGTGVFSGTAVFANSFPTDGPVIYGWVDGALGTTGGSGNNIALSWLYTGQVGIGITNPAFSLSVKNTQAIYGTGALGSTAATGGNLLFYTNSDSYTYPTLNFFQYDHNNCGILFDMYFGAGWFNATTGTGYGIHKNSDILQFTYMTGTAGTVGSLKSAMAITSSGYLGIGMTNPRDVLHTMGTSTSVIRIGASTAISSVSQLVFDQAISGYWHQSGYGNNPTTGARGAAYGAAMIQSGNESGNNYENSYMTFHTCRDPQSDGTGGLGVLYERMRINSLGYVGIGTNGPSYLLHVNGAINCTSFLVNGTAVATGTGSVWGVNGSSAYYTSGYVGIGTISPSAYCHVQNTNGDRHTSLKVTTMRAGLWLESTGGGGSYWNMWSVLNGETPSAGSLAFYSPSGFAMTLSPGGNITLGNSTSAVGINFLDLPAASWQITTGSYNLAINNNSASWTNRVTITQAGNVGIGTATPSSKFSVYTSVNSQFNVLDREINIIGSDLSGTSICTAITSNCAGTSTYGSGGSTYGRLGRLAVNYNPSQGGTGSASYWRDWGIDASGNFFFTQNQSTTQAFTIGSSGIFVQGATVGTTTTNTVGNFGLRISQLVSTQLTVGQIVGQMCFHGWGRPYASSFIRCITDSTNGYDDAGALAFGTASSGTGAVEVMRISETGNVGIGTTTPTYPISVATTGGTGLEINRTGASTNYGVGTMYSLTSTTGSFRGEYAWTLGGATTIATSAQSQAYGYYAIDLANAGAFGANSSYTGAYFFMTTSAACFPKTNVGIGTANPGDILSVYGTGSPAIRLYSTTTGYLQLGISGGVGGYSNSAIAGDSIIRAVSGNLMLQTGGGAAAIYINSSNQVGIGTASPGYALHVNGTTYTNGLTTAGNNGFANYAAFPNASGVSFGWNKSGGTGETNFLNCGGLGVGGFSFYNCTSASQTLSLIATISSSGTYTASDATLKTNIIPIKTNRSLARILALQPVAYQWIDQPSTNNMIGLLAQSTQAVNPHCVTEVAYSSDPTEQIEDPLRPGVMIDKPIKKLAINYQDIVLHLVGAIQEHEKTISTQAATIASQDARMAALEARLAAAGIM